jgi:hypothetical protein
MEQDEKKQFELKMLWHIGFWDFPHDGLAEYNGEKVYFKIENHPDPIDEYGLGEEYTKEFLKIEYDYWEKLYKFLPEDFDTDDIGEYKEYTVSRYDTFVIRKKLSYKIYRMPLHILQQYEDQNKKFNEAAGYQNWHDPNMYKLRIDAVDEAYWRKEKEPIEGFDVNNFEYLGSFYWDEFENFYRPFKAL